jgi:hypothetical protein
MGKNLFADDDKQLQPATKQPRNLFEDSAPEEEESNWKKIPRDVLIGLTHAGRNLHNLPHDIAHLADVVGSKIGRTLGAPELQYKDSDLASYLPYDKESYADVWGQKGKPSGLDTAIQKGVEYAPDVIGGLNALRGIGLLPHLTRRGASGSLRQARQLTRGRNIGPIDVDPNIIEDTAQFLPRTAPYRNAIEDAHYGDYDSLFRLQSDLGKHSSDYAGSLFSASERAHGRAGLATRNSLLDEMHAGLNAQGHQDISQLLRRGQDEYRRYMRFRPYRNAIGGAAALYAMPKNALIDLAKKLLSARNG